MKRFYQRVTVAEKADGIAVLLDDRPVVTPRRRPLVVPRLRLAEAIADEWRAQESKVLPRTMPMMRLAATAIDVVGNHRAKVVGDVAGYADTDLVCYWAESPADLLARQGAVWGPLLTWVNERYDVDLVVTRGVIPVAQPSRALATLRGAVEANDAWRLTGLAAIVAAAGSLVVGLALAEGRIDAGAAFDASRLDETFEIERWGEDAEAALAREACRATIADAARFLGLVKDSNPDMRSVDVCNG